ncbi:MAG: glycosyltransferase family 4 protein [Microthrixaceae bacterium]
MRIGLISPYSLSVPGGVQSQVLSLARSFRRRGHEALVLAPCDGPPPEVFVIPLGRSIPTATNGSVAPIAPDVPAQLRTMRALWDEDFDVIHLHEPLAPGPTVTAALLKPAPLVGTFHAAGEQPAYQKLSGLATWFGHRLDARVAVSEDARLMVAEVMPNDIRVLFNGIEGDRFRNAEPWPTSAPTIFFLGRHEPRKGLEVLLRAVPELPEDTQVWIGGTGPQTEDLQQRYTDKRVQWLGKISDSEREQRMRAATVFCAPSLGGESFGIILLEAMAAQTTVVASAISGYTQVATTPNGLAAELVEPGNASALAAALNRVLKDPNLGASLQPAASLRAQEFDLELLCQEYLEIYEGLVSAAEKVRPKTNTLRVRVR